MERKRFARPMRTTRALAVAVAAAAAVALIVLLWPSLPPTPRFRPERALPAPCRNQSFENVGYVVCEIDLRSHAVRLFHDGEDGKPFGSLKALDRAMAERGHPLLLAMNGGMYHEDLSPVGLYVEDGKVLSPLNSGDGKGNFYLKPNGVFLIGRNGEAAIVETSAYGAVPRDAEFATQSGPMLVIGGEVHPRFEENGTSRYIRNGVGLRDAHTVVLAISRSEVSLGSFARLFRDALGCPDALYLDGVVSALSDGREMVIGGAYPAGPIIAVAGG